MPMFKGRKPGLAAACLAAVAALWLVGGAGGALASTLPSWTSYLPGFGGSSSSTLPGWTSYLPGMGGSSSTTGTGSGSSAPGQGTTSLPGRLTTGSYTNGSGTLSYELYVPSTYRAGTSVPLVVALHGCTETADVYRQLSRWDAMAQSKGFIVLFPQQSSSRNSQSCWNWFQQADMQRGSGEPSIIMGMVDGVEQQYSVDARRVYVAGFSAGAAMANVMAATYPDVFAADGVGSGCEYDGLPCVGYQGPDPAKTGQEAHAAMGSHARVIPVIVFQGDADTIVAPANAPEIVREWQMTDDYADDGSLNGSIPTVPTGTTSGSVSGGRSYTVTSYGDGHGHVLIDYWLVHGMNHAWSGGNPVESYADPSGPDETAAMWSFFASHPLP